MEDDRDSFISKHITQACYDKVEVKPKVANIIQRVPKYGSIHKWIKRRKPLPDPPVCEECKQLKRLELANISGRYLYDVDDYKWLCHKCHASMDARNRLNKLLLLNIEEK